MENVSRRMALQMGAGAAAALVAGAAASKVAFADEATEEAAETVVNGTPYTKATNADEIGMIHEAATEEDFDVVVVGTGVAGVVCSMIVAEQDPDATVLLVEAHGYCGGGTNYAEQPDMPAMGCSLTEANLYGDQEAAAAHFIRSARLIAERKYDIGRNSAWLFKKHEIPMQISSGSRLQACFDSIEAGDYDFEWRRALRYEGGNGSAMITRLTTEIAEDEAYANIEIRLNTRGSALLVSDDGYTVTGIQLLNADGTYTTVNTKAVVLACGGMSNNLELLQYYSNQELSHCISVDQGHYGDGFVMVEQTAHGRCKTIALSSMQAAVDGLAWQSWLNLAAGQASTTVYINKSGARFVNEDMSRIDNAPTETGINRSALVEGQGAVYSIMGQNLLNYYKENGVSANSFYGDGQEDIEFDLDAELEGLVGNENFFQADTLEELADLIGVPQETFVEAIQTYDADCAAGADSLFEKDPSYLVAVGDGPYYAFKLCSIIVNTNGGVRVDEYCRVVDQDFNPVQGLYAAGLTISGFVTDLYDVGQCQSVSIWSGSKAARSLVEQCLGGTVADDWYGDAEWDNAVDIPNFSNYEVYEEYLASLEETEE